METKFNSQICTSLEQSKALVALGLKKETADCALLPLTDKVTSILVKPGTKDIVNTIPAWSLHRMLTLLPQNVKIGKSYYNLVIVQNEFVSLTDDLGDTYTYFDKRNLYESLLSCIEFLIKDGYFNKEYLV